VEGPLFKTSFLPEVIKPQQLIDIIEVQDLRFPSCLVMICGILYLFIYSYSQFVLGTWTRLLVIYSELLFCFSKI